MIKDCGTKKAFGGRNYIRIAVRGEEENNKLVEILLSL
ncbi:hemolysin erythrocyte lysis 2 domain protein [Bacteroides fragilis str. Ds-233]|nr:hemolysin erythrocyte lysis 2 domain protein [Bacteroides fragilis str. Ds-233]